MAMSSTFRRARWPDASQKLDRATDEIKMRLDCGMRKRDGLDGEMEASKEKMGNRGRLDETRLSPSLRDDEVQSTWTGRRDAIENNRMVRCNRHRLDDEVPSRSAIKINATAKRCNQGQTDDEMATRSKG